MELFARVSYFQIGDNFLRGRVVPAASEPSPWVYSQDFALYILENYFETGIVEDDEADQVEVMIHEWHPPIRCYELDFDQPKSALTIRDVIASRDSLKEFFGAVGPVVH